MFVAALCLLPASPFNLNVCNGTTFHLNLNARDLKWSKWWIQETFTQNSQTILASSCVNTANSVKKLVMMQLLGSRIKDIRLFPSLPIWPGVVCRRSIDTFGACCPLKFAYLLTRLPSSYWPSALSDQICVRHVVNDQKSLGDLCWGLFGCLCWALRLKYFTIYLCTFFKSSILFYS